MSGTILFYSDYPFGYHNPEAELRMAGFARRGYRVEYVQQLGIRNPRPRHLLRYVGSRRASPLGQDERPPFRVLSPRLLPPRRGPGVGALNRAWLARQLLSAVESPSETLFWIRYPTPELVPLVERVPWRLVIYELADNHGQPPDLNPWLRRTFAAAERRILARAGLVFAWSEPIRERLASLHPNVVLAPPAVDVERFAGVPAYEGRVACYVGSFDQRIDGELMLRVAQLLPDWTFVLAGRMANPVGRRLLAAPNVRVLGQLPMREIPRVLGEASVCLMPYRQGEDTRALFPIKLVEYLAAGKPVVSTPLPAMRDFGDVAEVAGEPEAFAQGIVDAARFDSPERRALRIERAAAFSWERRIDEMEAAIVAASRAYEPAPRRVE
jgi:glycosyltransferase involved in cell wall biosynthesis